ncbi:MAG: ADP-ribosylation factor-like protein [Candidatus Helarchaeota archaeon]
MQEKRIAFLGIQESGKTSFLTILKRKFGAIYKLKTTIGIERSNMNILGFNFFIADFGGQKLFREGYIKDTYKLLSNPDLLFYFVDVQSNNIEESFEYYKQFLNLPEIKSMDNSRIFVLIHKMDPDKRDLPEIKSRAEYIKKQFSSIKDVTFFETSIYDYWSVINCYSQGLNRIAVIKDILKKLLKEFARATFSSGVILLEENLFILEKHASNKKDLQIAESALKQFMNKWIEEVVKQESSKSIKKVSDFEMNIVLKKGKAYFQKFSFKDQIYFIMCYSKNPNTENLILKNIPKLAYRVYEISKGYFS